MIEGETIRGEKDPSGNTRYVIMEHKGDLHPQIVVEDPNDGKILDFYYMPERAHIEVDEGAGHLARYPARQDAPRSVAVRRTSPAVCRA